MSFSFLGGLASLLPNYVQGQRQAIQDNWQDLMNYNQVQSGQLSNAFTEATWQNRIDRFRDEAYNSNMNMLGNAMDFRTKWFMQPWQEMQAQAWTAYGPWNAPIGPESMWRQWQMANQQPNLGQAVSGNTGNAPSGVR